MLFLPSHHKNGKVLVLGLGFFVVAFWLWRIMGASAAPFALELRDPVFAKEYPHWSVKAFRDTKPGNPDREFIRVVTSLKNGSKADVGALVEWLRSHVGDLPQGTATPCVIIFVPPLPWANLAPILTQLDLNGVASDVIMRRPDGSEYLWEGVPATPVHLADERSYQSLLAFMGAGNAELSGIISMKAELDARRIQELYQRNDVWAVDYTQAFALADLAASLGAHRNDVRFGSGSPSLRLSGERHGLLPAVPPPFQPLGSINPSVP